MGRIHKERVTDREAKGKKPKEISPEWEPVLRAMNTRQLSLCSGVGGAGKSGLVQGSAEYFRHVQGQEPPLYVLAPTATAQESVRGKLAGTNAMLMTPEDFITMAKAKPDSVSGALVIWDEIGMAGARQVGGVLAACKDRAWGVRGFGDVKQMPPDRAGSPLYDLTRELAKDPGTKDAVSKVSHAVRHRDPAHKAVAHLLHEGTEDSIAEALDQLQAMGKLKEAPSRASALEMAAKDMRAFRADPRNDGETSVITATSHRDAQDANIAYLGVNGAALAVAHEETGLAMQDGQLKPIRVAEGYEFSMTQSFHRKDVFIPANSTVRVAGFVDEKERAAKGKPLKKYKVEVMDGEAKGHTAIFRLLPKQKKKGDDLGQVPAMQPSVARDPKGFQGGKADVTFTLALGTENPDTGKPFETQGRFYTAMSRFKSDNILYVNRKAYPTNRDLARMVAAQQPMKDSTLQHDAGVLDQKAMRRAAQRASAGR